MHGGGEEELRGQPANPRSPGKMAVKTECVCVHRNEDVGFSLDDSISSPRTGRLVIVGFIPPHA